MSRVVSLRKAALLDRTGIPRYRQIEAILRDQIFSGELATGDKVPTEVELAMAYGVSRPTVRQALQILEQDRLIFRRAGRGTFVTEVTGEPRAPKISLLLDDLVDLTEDTTIRLQRSGTAAARGEVQSALGLSFGEEVRFFVRVYRRRGEPFGGAKVYLPPAVAGPLDRKLMLAPRLLDALARRIGTRIETAEQRLEATRADARTGAIFDAAPGTPMISIHRTSRTASGQPVEHCHMLFRSDRCQFRFVQRRSASGTWTIRPPSS
jgi:GntR family transcriptional regulator